MKLFERAILNILRKPIKTLILLCMLVVILNILCGAQITQKLTKQLMNEIGKVIEPIVMIERPIMFDDDHVNLSSFSFEDKENLDKYDKLMKAYSEICNLNEIKYCDIGESASLYNEEMRNVIKHSYQEDTLLDDYDTYKVQLIAVQNKNSYFFENNTFEIIEGRNLTEEEIQSGANVIVVNRTMNVEKDGVRRLAKIGDKITFGTRILSEDYRHSKEYTKYLEIGRNDLSNEIYLELLKENDLYEFEIVGIFEETPDSQIVQSPIGIISHNSFEIIKNNYHNKLFELEDEGIIKKYNSYNTRFNYIYHHNSYSVFKLKNQDDIKEFKNKVDEIMVRYGFDEYEFTYSNDAYLKVIGPLESLNSVSSFILMFGIIVGVILLGLISIIFIRERKHEIGILLTLGETKKKIIKQLMLEMLLIGLLAIFTTSFTSKYLVNGLQENVLSSYEESVQLSENDEVMLGNMSTKEISDKYEELFETSDSLLITVVSASSMMLVCYGSMFIILKMNPKDIMM